MKSRTTRRFRKAFAALPEDVQRQSREVYRRFRDDPTDPRLRFKRVHPTKPIYSVRVGIHYRALGVRTDDEIVWFWIGSHADYDGLLSSL